MDDRELQAQAEASAQQPQQQVPTSAPADGGGAGMELPKGTMEQLQSRVGSQEKLAMPGINPKMQGASAKDILIAGALGQFVPFLGAAVMQHSKKQKEQQVNEAVNEFMALDGIWDAAWQRASIEAKGDQAKTKQLAQQYASQDPRMEALFGGPKGQKRLKNFAKVFQQPWMNDGGTTPHTEGLKKFLQLKPASHMLEGLASHILGRRQQAQQPGQGQPQGQPQPGQQPGQGQPQPQGGQPGGQQQPDIMANLPHKIVPPDEKNLKSYADYLKVVDDQHKVYDMKFDSNGKPFAFNSRTGEAKEVMVQKSDGKGGYTPTMPVRGRSGVAIVDNVPIGMYGVMDDGNWGVKTPQSKNWTGADAQAYEAAKSAWAMGEKKKDDRVKLSAEWRARAFAGLHPYSLYDTETGNMVEVDALHVHDNPDRYVGGTAAMQLTTRLNLFNEIHATEQELRRTIANMGDVPFDEQTRAQIAALLKTDSPSSGLAAFFKSNVADTLTSAQIEYVTALASMEESALSLRTLGGMGQGSDMMRAAILRMVPGAGTPSAKYALRQLDLLDIELKGLKQNMPGLGNLGGGKDKKQTFQDYLNELKKKRAGGG